YHASVFRRIVTNLACAGDEGPAAASLTSHVIMVPHLHRLVGIKLFFLPVQTRLPLKFGAETLTSVTCLRVAMTVADQQGQRGEGWGEPPLSVQWVWPSSLPYHRRHEALLRFSQELATAWMQFAIHGRSLETGYDFQEQVLPQALDQF